MATMSSHFNIITIYRVFRFHSIPFQFHMVWYTIVVFPLATICSCDPMHAQYCVNIFNCTQSNVLDFTVSIVYFGGKSFLVNFAYVFSYPSVSPIQSLRFTLHAEFRSLASVICSVFFLLLARSPTGISIIIMAKAFLFVVYAPNV